MIIINESKSLNSAEQDALVALLGSDARAGIVEARDIIKKIEHDGTLVFTPHELDFLSYYKDNIKSKRLSKDQVSAIKKIFNM